MCPGDCGDSCEDVEAAIAVFADQVATGCTTDDECHVLPVAPCALGDAITCHGLPYRQGADPSSVEKLITGAIQVGCEYAACDCQLDQAVCLDGVCVPSMQ